MRSPTSHRLKTCVACVAALLSALTGCANPWLQPSVPSDPPPGSAIEYRRAPPSRPKAPPAPKTRPGQLPTAPATLLEPKHKPAERRPTVRYEDITRDSGPISEDHDALAIEAYGEAALDGLDDSGEHVEPHDVPGVPPREEVQRERGQGDAGDPDEDLTGVKISDLALEDRPDRRDVSGRVVVPRAPKRPETVDPSIYAPRFTPEGIAFPYPTTKMFRGFGPCRGRRHHHEGIDLGGVGPDWGIGTPIRSMAKAEVTFIGLGEDNPDDFGLPDKRKGEALRGDRMLPRSLFIEPYGDVFFFTRKKGRWRSGNIVVTKAVDGPLEGHVIRYLHLGGVHPDIDIGTVLEAGDELGVMGGTGVQESAPHLHLDITAPSGRRVDVAPLLGLPPTATCKVSDEPAEEARTTSRKPEERSRLTDPSADEERHETTRKRTSKSDDELSEVKDRARHTTQDKTSEKKSKAEARDDAPKTKARDDKAKTPEADGSEVDAPPPKAKDDMTRTKARNDDETRAKVKDDRTRMKAKDDGVTEDKPGPKAKDDKSRDRTEGKIEDEKTRARERDKDVRSDRTSKPDIDDRSDRTSKPDIDDDHARRSTLKAGALKLPKCKTTKRAEDFGSGRHDAHAMSVELDAGQVLTVELMRGSGSWKPRLEIVGEVEAKSLASGKIGGKAVSSIRAKSASKVQVIVSGWDKGRPPRDASYTLKIAEKCKR